MAPKGERDERYRFQGLSQDFLVGLGRLTLGATYLQDVLETMLWRLIDNGDLAVGQRLSAGANFRWLCDHTRAVSEYRLPAHLHADMTTWIAASESAYRRRSRIVHSGHAISLSADGNIEHLWIRVSAHGDTFARNVTPARAKEVHDIAVELEHVGLNGVDLMRRLQDVLTAS